MNKKVFYTILLTFPWNISQIFSANAGMKLTNWSGKARANSPAADAALLQHPMYIPCESTSLGV